MPEAIIFVGIAMLMFFGFNIVVQLLYTVKAVPRSQRVLEIRLSANNTLTMKEIDRRFPKDRMEKFYKNLILMKITRADKAMVKKTSHVLFVYALSV